MSKAAVILAAGAGTRFSNARGAKLLATAKGRPLVGHAVSPALEAGLDEVIVVEGPTPLEAILPQEVTVLRNSEWRRGQATSLRVGIDWCQRQGHEAVVVSLGDIPGVTAEAWRAVARAEGGPVVVATYQRRRGHPVRLDADIWPMLPIEGDEGARTVMAQHPELVIEVACPGSPHDIDTREDLRRWS